MHKKRNAKLKQTKKKLFFSNMICFSFLSGYLSLLRERTSFDDDVCIMLQTSCLLSEHRNVTTSYHLREDDNIVLSFGPSKLDTWQLRYNTTLTIQHLISLYKCCVEIILQHFSTRLPLLYSIKFVVDISGNTVFTCLYI